MIIISSPTVNHRNPNVQAAKSSIGAAAAPSRFGLLTLVPRTVGEEERKHAARGQERIDRRVAVGRGRVVGGQNFLVSRPHEGRTGTDQPGTASSLLTNHPSVSLARALQQQ